MLPPLPIEYKELCQLIGEKEVTIYQLGEQFNKLAEENARLQTRIKELEDGKLEQSVNNDAV